MNLYRLKTLLWTVNALLLAGALLAFIAAAWWPFRLPQRVEMSVAAAPAAADHAHVTPPLETFAPLWDRDFQQPLFDGQPVAQAVTAFPATLTGTIIEPGFSRAVFRLDSGGTQMHGVGGAVAGAEVLEIAADRVVLRFQGERMTLQPNPKASSPGAQP
jgi:hypothetical protein